MIPNDKVALITGAAHRVGKAIALRLAQRGCHIALHYRSAEAEARATQAELEALGVEVLPIQADVSEPDAIQAMVDAALAHFKHVDILVNSAATFMQTPFPDFTLAEWDAVINTNLRGPYLCARALAPHMLTLPEAAIINITDMSAFAPIRNMMVHSIAKAGLVSLTQSLALELRPTVRVNAIAPGPVIPPPDYSPEQTQKSANVTLLKRWGSGDNVAQTVLLLVENDFMTAEIVRVDGGESVGWRDGQEW